MRVRKNVADAVNRGEFDDSLGITRKADKPARPRSGYAVNPTSKKSAGRIPDELWSRAIVKAQAGGRPLSSIITAALERWLAGEIEL